MRLTIGFIIIFINLSIFSYTLVGAITQYNQVKPVQQVLDEKINIKDITVPQNSYIYDGIGNLISEIYNVENRIYLEFEDIPGTVVQAFISTEDQHFFDHKGFDITGISRAFVTNTREESIKQGGSTISQQLVRNLYFNNDKSYNRKLSEALYAYKLEEEWSKEDILELYVNTIYFGNGTYGIEAASQFYFSRPISELSLAETAFLCAIPNNPSFYEPITNYDNTVSRQKWILQKMIEMSYITARDYDQALSENIQLDVYTKIDEFPGYVSYVYDELEQLVADNEGFTEQLMEASDNEKIELERKLHLRVTQLLQQGLRIETALQPEVQNNVINVIKSRLPEKDIEGAAVVIDHKRHELIAIVGDKDYEKFNFHRAYQAYRQPGSSIKPLLAYAPYIEEYGLSPWNTVNAGTFCKQGYCPRNYGGSKHGTVSIEAALKYSYNTAAVRIVDQMGIEKAFHYLEQFNFQKVVQADYVLPAAIGGFTHGITPLEMTNAYTTFANNGIYEPARAIRKVTDLEGNDLFKWHKKAKKVWSASTNTKMKSLLNKVVTEGTGTKGYFYDDYIGGKTGTTDNYKDLWFIGLTANFTTGVWVGKDKPQSIQYVNNRSPQLMIWKDIMYDLSNEELDEQ